MHVGVLGAAEVRLEASWVDLGPLKQRALLAVLALHRGCPVPVDTVVDLLWGEAPPATVTATLQGYVSHLRRALEPDRAPRSPSAVLVTRHPGYALVLPREALDAERFELGVGAAFRQGGSPALPVVGPGADRAETRELEQRYVDLEAALALWRGTPFAELEAAPAVVAERSRLEELRLVAVEHRASTALELGRHATVAAELEALTATYPLRERLWSLRAIALTRSGRQADALDALRRVRELLADELGLEPGVELRSLQAAVLRQDPALDWPPAPPRAATMRETTGSTPLEPPGTDVGRRTPEADWPLVGREAEIAALRALVDEAEAGPPRVRFAVLTGEAGIGKSRLWAEAARHAEAAGFRVLVGGCSQDEGAPPLWPWAMVLAGLGRDLPTGSGAEDGAARFRAWNTIVHTVLDLADRPTLLVLDDLHWADASTLRVLRLLAEGTAHGRLVVLATWRHQPPPTGALAETAEALARRHAVRLHLDGLDAAEAGQVVAAVAETLPSTGDAEALRSRTDGNPFFLVEYARLARDRGLAGLLREDHPPAAVHDVLARRVAALTEATARTLRTASVLGREFDLETLAAALSVSEERVLDDLDPALTAGLVGEDGVDRFRFAHALVHDTLYAALPRSRRARVHARAAGQLADSPGRESEVARHWLLAGPQLAGQAWRAAVLAAAAARQVFAYDESVALLREALCSLSDDPEATAAAGYDVRLDLARSLRLAGDWVGLRATVHELVLLADELDDAERSVDALTTLMTGALWQSAPLGEVDRPLVAALRRALDRLPVGDSPARCRLMLLLSMEIYYGSTPAEHESLAEEAIVMARAVGEGSLLLDACLIGAVAIWRGATAERRLELADEARRLARGLGDEFGLASALTLRVTFLGELGRVAEMEADLALAREHAARTAHVYAQAVLDSGEAAWMALRGDFPEVQRVIDDLVRLRESMGLSQLEEAVGGATAVMLLWQGRHEEMLEVVRAVARTSKLATQATVAALMCRAGQVEEARSYLADHPIDLDHDDWFSPWVWSMSAETSLHLGLPDLARTSYQRLTPLRGRLASAGSGNAIGPADAFLAMAAAAAGWTVAAAEHAEDALRQCEQWRIPLAAAWFRDVRARFGF